MMSLHGVSINVGRSSNVAQMHGKAPSISASSISSGPIPPPAAVQSMLKTTTELGDVSQLVCTRRHIPSSGPRLQSTRIRSGSFDSSFASALRHQQSPQSRPVHRRKNLNRTAPDSDVTRHDAARFHSLLQSNASRIGKHNRDRYSSHLHDRGYHRMPLRPLHSYRSFTPLRDHEDNKSRNSYSSSRLSARTDIRFSTARQYEQDLRGLEYTSRLHHLRTGKRSSTASSPASVATLAGVGAFRYDNNVSISSSTRLPCPASSMSYFGNTHSSDNSKIRDDLTNIRNINRVGHSGLFQSTPSHGSSHSSRVPLYYDYSESFMEEECFSPDVHALRLVCSNDLDQTIVDPDPAATLQQFQSRFTTKIGSPSFPAELPTPHNRWTTEIAPLSRETDDSIADACLEKTVQVADVAELLANGKEDVHLPLLDKEPFELEASTGHLHTVFRPPRTFSSTSIFFLSRDRSQRDLAALAARLHSLDVEIKPKSDLAALDKVFVPKQLSLEEPQLSKRLARNNTLFEPSAPTRPNTSPIDLSQTVSKTICPQPKRPMSLQSSKHFQQIVEINNVRNFHEGEVHEDKRLLETWKFDSTRDFKDNEQSRANQSIANLNSTHKACDGTGFTESPVIRKDNRSSVSISNGKSTVESLLDKHIESLGLMPESDTSSSYSGPMEAEYFAIQCHSKDQVKPSESPLTLSAVRYPQVSSDARLSPSSSTRMRLKPRRLFASMDGCITAFPEPLWTTANLGSEVMSNSQSLRLRGWQSLPSTNHGSSIDAVSRPTVSSGAMADIDTDVYPLGRRVWRLSQLSLPTTLEERIQETLESHESRKCRRSRSELIARKESHRRRRIRIHLKQQNRTDSICNLLVADNRTETYESRSHRHQRHSPNTSDCAELVGDQPDPSKLTLRSSSEKNIELDVSKRWSEIIAAMPVPVTGMLMPSRKMSVRTQCSQRSFASQNSIVDPLNSTRQRLHVSHPGNMVPILTKPKVGPAPSASTLNLSIPYAEAPSTVHPSLYETRSFFEDSPSPRHTLRRSIRRQFGLRPLRSAVQRSRVLSLPARNGIPIAAVGPSLPPRTKSVLSHRAPKAESKFTSTSGFVHGKRKAIERLKDWWRRRCIQKIVAGKNA